MSSEQLSSAEKHNDLIAMCQIAETEQFSFETVFYFLNEHRSEERDISPVFKEFLLWLLDKIYEQPTRDKGDYVLQTIDIGCHDGDEAFFSQIVTHPVVGKSAWPMMSVCARRAFKLMDVLFDVYDDDHLQYLSEWMLKSNLQEGVREHLEQNLFALQSQRQSEHIAKSIDTPHAIKSNQIRKI